MKINLFGLLFALTWLMPVGYSAEEREEKIKCMIDIVDSDRHIVAPSVVMIKDKQAKISLKGKDAKYIICLKSFSENERDKLVASATIIKGDSTLTTPSVTFEALAGREALLKHGELSFKFRIAEQKT